MWRGGWYFRRENFDLGDFKILRAAFRGGYYFKSIFKQNLNKFKM